MGRPANLLIVIPARLAATRLPRKPLDVRLARDQLPDDLARLGTTYPGAA